MNVDDHPLEGARVASDDSWDETGEENTHRFMDALTMLALRWKSLLLATVVAGAAGLGAAFLMTPVFTATTLFIPPQAQQSGASAALASLGALAGLAGSATGVKSTTDQYVALMGSVTVADRIIDKFDLMTVYKTPFRYKARGRLSKNVAFTIGKKDGLVSIAVEDADPKRAASIANQYVEELRRLTSVLAVSEAQRRRMFFEKQLEETKGRLTAAQIALQATGFTEGALKSEPKAAAEGYAQLRAQLTATQVALQTMRESHADSSSEVLQLSAKLRALKDQVRAQEASAQGNAPIGDADYVGKYREFKYQETLFDLMARQYELARVDESREGALIQVVDVAQPPEHKTRPARLLIGLAGAAMGAIGFAIFLLVRARLADAMRDPETAARVALLKASLSRRTKAQQA